jgi:hypothetical protein
MKLFAVYIGGDIAGAHLELHDLRFVFAPTIEETYDQLRREWWGTPASLHLDCWAELSHSDGYEISLRPEPATQTEKLFFVHLGGYDGTFGEAHRNLFLVATSAQEAKTRAVSSIKGWRDPHRDALFEIEKTLNLSELAASHAQHIHLHKIDNPAQPGFTCNYRKIGLKLREA